MILSLKASGAVVRDPELGLDYSRVVHGEQKFAYSRPIVAGDELVVTTTIEAIRTMAGNDMITTRGDIATVDGEHVVTTTSLLIARGPEDDVMTASVRWDDVEVGTELPAAVLHGRPGDPRALRRRLRRLQRHPLERARRHRRRAART